MESNVNYTVVGAFTIALIAAIVIIILWLSAGLTETHYTTYRVYMNEAVTGLSIGGPVKYNGVDVGNVQDIDLNHNNPQQVELLLNIKVGTPITVDTTATLVTQGITGIAYIALISKGSSTTLLRARPGEKYPTIKTRPSLLLRLDTALSELTSNVNQMTTKIIEVLNPQNQQSIKQALINLDQLTNSLTQNSQQLNTVLHNTGKATQAFTNQTIPAFNQTITNFNGISNNLLDISAEIKQNPSILIRGKTPQPLGPGEH